MGAESYFGFHVYVNVYNDNVVLTDTDVTLPGRGSPISIQRAYNLRSDAASPIGDRWTLNVYMKLSFSDGEIVKLTDSDGTVTFSNKEFIPPLYSSLHALPKIIHLLLSCY
ncbi:MAG: hypothetical protein A2Y23_12165 [Clostridiales bacterium GWB2_37_7]|nr:MAG: hypothetical protein A2Y23_12165 [Clostridiales bacterium GWB2_37_7]